MRILVVGMRWPPETFLTRLIRGLADHGVDMTIACHTKPDDEWLSHPHCHWLHTPKWDGFIPGRFARLGRMALQGFIRSPSDIVRLGRSLSGDDRRDAREIVSGTSGGWGARSEERGAGSGEQGARSREHGAGSREHGARGAEAVVRLRFWYRVLPFVGRRWDVIYFPWNSAAIEHLPLFDLGCPVVVSCRGSQVNVAPHNPKRYAIREGLKDTFQRAAAVHCVSEATKREAIKYGLNPSKAWVIHPAVDPDYFHPAGLPGSSTNVFRLVTVGNLSWVKGHEYALLAVRRLVDYGIPVEFDIIGDGPERQRLLYTIHDLELQRHVRLRGHIPPERVRDALQQAHAFLLSSLSEGISNAALEAMACGVPVVTTDCGGMREAVTDGVNGFVVSVRDPEAMAEALLTLWREPALRQRMGRAARDTILRRFTLERQIEEFASLFESTRGKISPH